MPWLYLLIAIILEVAGTTCMKLSDGFARVLPSVGVGVFYLVSMAAMVMAVKTLEIGTVYAIWSGVGTAVITTIGVIYFGESFSLINIGVVGLQLSNTH